MTVTSSTAISYTHSNSDRLLIFLGNILECTNVQKFIVWLCENNIIGSFCFKLSMLHVTTETISDISVKITKFLTRFKSQMFLLTWWKKFIQIQIDEKMSKKREKEFKIRIILNEERKNGKKIKHFHSYQHNDSSHQCLERWEQQQRSNGGEMKGLKWKRVREEAKKIKIMNNFYDNAFNMLIFLTQANGWS